MIINRLLPALPTPKGISRTTHFFDGKQVLTVPCENSQIMEENLRRSYSMAWSFGHCESFAYYLSSSPEIKNIFTDFKQRKGVLG